MHRFLLTLFLLTLLPGSAAAGSTVAVFDIEDQTRRLKKHQLRTLQEMLASKLVERRRLQVIPRDVLRAALAKKRRWRCFDWKCQKPVAKGLKANYVMATKILKLGKKCLVMGSLYNIKTSLLQYSASLKSGCKLDALATAMEKLPARLTGKLKIHKPVRRAKVTSPGEFDEPGIGAGEKAAKPKKGAKVKVDDVELDERPTRARKPMPLWPGLAAAGVGVVGLTLGIPFIALDGTGHNCDGADTADYSNCEQLWNTGTMGWIFTGMGIGALATSGVLLYFHYFSRDREQRAASVPAFTVTPTPDGGLFVGATGRF